MTGTAQIQEQINLAYHSALVDGQGTVTESALETALKTEFNKSSLDDGWLDKTSVTGKWRITIDNVSLDVPEGTTSTHAQVDPSVEYGYKEKAELNGNELKEASTLGVGDLINYYYDTDPNHVIPCVVMYNDNTHGVQVISVNSVRDVTLGCSSDGTTVDPKAVEAFADKDDDEEEDAPTGYTVSNFEKSRWSYNNAIATLNSYARDYLGDMAISARCVGAPEVEGSGETTDMFTANASYTYFSSYNGKFKDTDTNVDDNTTGSNANEDLNTMHQLGIIQTPNSNNYWLASRLVNSYSNYSDFRVRYVGDYGDLLDRFYLCGVYSSSTGTFGCSLGFRPIFHLKSDIQVEKTGHQNYGAGGFTQ